MNLKKKVAVGFAVLGVKRVLVQVVFTTTNIFLARLLYPQDFGIYAILGFVSTVFAAFSDLGLGQSLIQRKERLESKDLQTVFSFQLLLSLGIILLINLLAPFVSGFYGLGDKGIHLIRIYSLFFLFSPFKTISWAVLERDLEYLKLVVIELIEILVASLITITLAFLGFGVFSFVLGAVLGHFVGSVSYFSFSHWRIRLGIDKSRLVRIAKFGLPLQSSVLSGVFYGPLVLLNLGKKVGAENLGYFQFAASLSVLPIAVSEIMNRIIFPLGARVQEEKEFFKKVIERSIIIVSFTTLPTVFVMLVTARQIIRFIYTDKWLPALPALYFGILQIGIVSFTAMFSQLLLSKGYSKTIGFMGLTWAILTWLLAPYLIGKYNFVGMSMTGFLVSLSGIWLFFRLKRVIIFSWWINFWPFLISSIACGLVTYIFVNSAKDNLISVLIGVMWGLILYLCLVWFFAQKVLVFTLKSLFSSKG